MVCWTLISYIGYVYNLYNTVSSAFSSMVVVISVAHDFNCQTALKGNYYTDQFTSMFRMDLTD